MQKTLNILLVAVVLALFSVSAYAQVADKVFIETPDGKLVKLSVNGQTAMLGLRRLPTALQVKVTGSPVVDLPNQLTYTYHDELGRTENTSVLSWYLADDAAGTNATKVASGANYTPLLANVPKYLRAGVLAVGNKAGGGTISGDEVFTPWVQVRGTFYQNAYQGTGIQHMTFLVVNVDFGAGHLVAGDEIAIFDGAICTAHATVTGPVVVTDQNSFVSLAASRVDAGADGFTPGHAITIRVWIKATSLTTDYVASPEFVDPVTGDPIVAPVFAESESAFVRVTVTP